MKKINWGKRFENNFRESGKGIDDIIIERLVDTQGMRKNVKTPSDFICYYYPNIYYLEMKSIGSNRLPLANISEHQWLELHKRKKTKGCISGVCINYRIEDDEQSYFLDIDTLQALRNAGDKSISVDQAKELGIKIEGKLKKVNVKYDIKSFFDKLKNAYYIF